ncbi:hypothetical protein K6Y31_20675 [Motilimonas cestriensis]|uniref:Uncharacterized protein n=1 Tax=Motilimonas cestriensis TaxID=2742685 RepID=A0ABS8WG74_9GAMM|nr:hypothetical protein [Motilimonas cestriensis]MCE2597192.1 hypothetical protein [Motilimonas cestriensis]
MELTPSFLAQLATMQSSMAPRREGKRVHQASLQTGVYPLESGEGDSTTHFAPTVASSALRNVLVRGIAEGRSNWIPPAIIGAGLRSLVVRGTGAESNQFNPPTTTSVSLRSIVVRGGGGAANSFNPPAVSKVELRNPYNLISQAEGEDNNFNAPSVSGAELRTL